MQLQSRDTSLSGLHTALLANSTHQQALLAQVMAGYQARAEVIRRGKYRVQEGVGEIRKVWISFAEEMQKEWLTICQSFLEIATNIATIYQLKLDKVEGAKGVVMEENEVLKRENGELRLEMEVLSRKNEIFERENELLKELLFRSNNAPKPRSTPFPSNLSTPQQLSKNGSQKALQRQEQLSGFRGTELLHIEEESTESAVLFDDSYSVDEYRTVDNVFDRVMSSKMSDHAKMSDNVWENEDSKSKSEIEIRSELSEKGKKKVKRVEQFMEGKENAFASIRVGKIEKMGGECTPNKLDKLRKSLFSKKKSCDRVL